MKKIFLFNVLGKKRIIINIEKAINDIETDSNQKLTDEQKQIVKLLDNFTNALFDNKDKKETNKGEIQWIQKHLF